MRAEYMHKIKWPCGLEYEMAMQFKAFWADGGIESVDIKDIDLWCPMHGRYCPEKPPNGHALDDEWKSRVGEGREGSGIGLVGRFKRWLRGSESA